MDELIKRLSYDKAFGILTKNALEEEISKVKGKFNYLFMDLCNIKKLNHILGYEGLNKVVKRMFKEFNNKDYVIGRWFSGDEIVIITKDIESVLARLIIIARRHNISFKWMGFYDRKSVKQMEGDISKANLLNTTFQNKENEVSKSG